MNANDPILTAYALDELEPHERAQIEQLLREHPQAADEIDDIRKVASVLNTTLRLEPSEGLSAKHREHILRVAGVPQKRPLPTNVVEGPSWWKSWQFATTAAACMVFGFGAYAIFDALTTPRPKYATVVKANEVLAIGVPKDDVDRRHRVVAEESGDPAEPQRPDGKIAMQVAAAPSPTKITLFPPEIRGQLAPQVPKGIATPVPEPNPESLAASSNSPSSSTPARSGTEPMLAFSKPTAASPTRVDFSTVFTPIASRKSVAIPLTFNEEKLSAIKRSLGFSGKVRIQNAVDIHGLVNSFKFNYPQPFGIVGMNVEIGAFPMDPELQLVQIGITARQGNENEIVAENVAAEVEFDSSRVESFALVGNTSSNRQGVLTGAVLRAGQSATSLCLFVPAKDSFGQNAKVLSVRLRYTVPGHTFVHKVEQHFGKTAALLSSDFRWAAAVASFGWAFHKGDASPATWAKVSRVSREALLGTADEERKKFGALVQQVKDGIVY